MNSSAHPELAAHRGQADADVGEERIEDGAAMAVLRRPLRHHRLVRLEQDLAQRTVDAAAGDGVGGDVLRVVVDAAGQPPAQVRRAALDVPVPPRSVEGGVEAEAVADQRRPRLVAQRRGRRPRRRSRLMRSSRARLSSARGLVVVDRRALGTEPDERTRGTRGLRQREDGSRATAREAGRARGTDPA